MSPTACRPPDFFSVSPGRLAEPADPTPPPPPPPPRPKHRTAAQAAASRRNGSRSRGPRTAAGKLQSRQNGRRHGLFAKAVCPPADGTGQHEDYARLLEQLRADHGPRTALQAAMVETLAADLLHLRRVVELRQEAFAMHDYDVHLEEQRPMEVMEDELDLERSLVQACAAGTRFHLAAAHVPGAADNVACDIVGWLERRAADAQGPSASAAAGGLPVDEEAQWCAAALGEIRPADLGVCGAAVAAVLGDQRAIPAADRHRWLLLFQAAVKFKEGQLRWRRREHERAEPGRRRARQGFLKARLPGTESLAKAEAHARRALRNTLALLVAAGCRPGAARKGEK